MAQQYNPLIKHGFQKFNDYSLPVAGADTLGGVKVGSGLSIDENGVLSADGGGGYTLPVAGADTLGGVKVGSGLSIDANGILSQSPAYIPCTCVFPNPYVHLDGYPQERNTPYVFNHILYFNIPFECVDAVDRDGIMFYFKAADDSTAFKPVSFFQVSAYDSGQGQVVDDLVVGGSNASVNFVALSSFNAGYYELLGSVPVVPATIPA